MKQEIWKRLISGLLAFSLLFGMMPSAYAAEAAEPTATQETVTEPETQETTAPSEPAQEPSEPTESAGDNARAVDENAGIATADYVDGGGTGSSKSDPYILLMKDGKCTNDELIAFVTTKYYTGTSKFVIDNTGPNLWRIKVNDVELSSGSSNYGLTDGNVYSIKQYKAELWGYGNESQQGSTKYFIAKTYYDIGVSITSSDGTLASTDGITIACNGTQYASGGVISQVLENLGTGSITITVQPVEDTAIKVSMDGAEITAGANNSYVINPSKSGTLTIDYVAISSAAMSVSSNQYGKVSYSGLLDKAAISGESPVNGSIHITADLGSALTLNAVPEAGCAFYRWLKTDANGQVSALVSGASLTVNPEEGVAYTAQFEKTDTDEYVALKKDTIIHYLNSELPSAIESAASGEYIVLIEDATLYEDVTIPNGVTFLLPYSLDDTSVSTSSDTLYANAHWQGGNATFYGPGENTTVILKVTNNSTITVDGQLILGGQIYSHTLGLAGYVGGKHSDIQMENGSTIVVNNVLSACGYITGGEVEISASGKVYQPFVLGDFRGGTYCSAAYTDNNITAFNMYTQMNVRSDVTVLAGGQMMGYAYLYAGDQDNNSAVAMIAPSNALIITGADTTVKVTFEEKVKTSGNGKADAICHATVRFDGDVTFGSMSLRVKLGITSSTINTANIDFPIPYNYTLVLGSGGTYTASSDFKIMPGGEVIVESGATLVVPSGKTLVVYDGLNDRGYANSYYPTGAELSNIGLSEAGSLVVNGILKVEEKATLAGYVQTTTSGAKIQIDSAATLTGSYQEGVIKKDGSILGITEGATHTCKVSGTLTAKLFDHAAKNWIDMAAGTTYYSFEGTSVHTLDNTYSYVSYADDKTGTETVGTYAVVPTLYGSWGTPSMVFYNGSASVATYSAADYEAGSVEIPTAQREGYDFVGWYTAEDGGEQVYSAEQVGTSVAMPCNSITLYAHFTPKEYRIQFEANGGSDVTAIAAVYGADISNSNPVTNRTGYVFGGWYTNADLSGDAYVFSTMPMNGLTLYAKWTAIPYKVVWDLQYEDVNGSPDSLSDVIFDETAITLPVTDGEFYRDGYDLSGWSLEPEGQPVENGTLKEMGAIGSQNEDGTVTVTLYAIWTPVVYTVKLHPNGGDLSKSGWKQDGEGLYVKDYTVEQSITLPEITIEGYTVTWKCGEIELKPGAVISKPEQAQTYEAEWKPIDYAVTLYLNSDDATPWKTLAYNIESETTELPEAEKNGYSFEGWKDADGKIWTSVEKGSTGDLVLTADWSLNEYQLTLETDFGQIPVEWKDKTFTVESGDITLPVLQENGYTFHGWKDSAGVTWKKIPAGTTGAVSLEAQWEIIKYTISLDTKGGTLTQWNQNTYYVNSGDIILPAGEQITKEGYSFAGWVDAEGNIVTQIPAGSTGNRSFRASWSANQYTISFVTYCEASVDPIQKEYGSTVAAPGEITRTGYTFGGWYEKQDFSGEEFEFATMPAEDVTLYAKWNAISYTITLDTNGGVLPESAATQIPYTIEDAVCLPVPTLYGYDFAGWFENGQKLESGTVSASTGDRSFKAEWTPKQVRVTLNANGGTFGTQTTLDMPATFGASYVSQGFQIPTRTGYRFDYWMLGGADVSEQKVSMEEAHELDAHWSAKTYDVVLDAGEGIIAGTQTNTVTIQAVFDSTLGTLPQATREGYDFAGWYQGDTEITAETVLKSEGAAYTARWNAQVYQITLDYGYDEKKESTQVTFGQPYSNGVINPSRTGYTFDGWFADAQYTQTLDLNSLVAAEHPAVLYAKWTALQFTITYQNMESVTSEIRTGFDSDELPLTLEIPVMAGHTFDGWTWEGSTEPVKEYIIPKGTASNLKLTANWSVNSYTLTFDTTGGTQIDPITAAFGTAFTVLDPEKTGYIFAGWQPMLPGTVPAEDTLYTAQWTPIVYEVKYELNGGSWNTANADPSGPVHYETVVALPGAESCGRTGYILTGWKQEGKDDLLSAPCAALTATNGAVVVLTAQWEPITYQVAYEKNVPFADAVVENLPLSQTGIKYDEQFAVGAAPSLVGYTFLGWALSENEEATYPAQQKVSNLTDVNGAAVTLYAKWQLDTYTVSYTGLDGIENTDLYPTEYNVHTQQQTLIKPVKTGYTFLGWNEKDNLEVSIGGGQIGNLELTALWTANTYQVTFAGNGATAGENATQSWTYDQPHKLPDNSFEKTGYHFTGWLVGEKILQPGAEAGNLSAQQGAAVTVYAQWEPNGYTVEFNGNGADEDSSMASQSMTYDESCLLNSNTFSRTGYTFTGWNTAQDGSGTVYADKAEVINLAAQGSITLYAQWKVNRYTITFANTGDTQMEAITADYGTPIAAVANPTRLGYEFLGWDKEIPATMPAEDTVITGSWKEATFTLTLDYGNGTEPVVQSWLYLQNLEKPEDPVREGYTFGGWFTEPNGEGTRYYVIGKTDCMPAENVKLAAYWTPNPYTIFFIENGGSQAKDITLNYGSKISEADIPATQKDGYTFAGWYDNAALAGDAFVFTTMPLNGKVLYAKWEPNAYTVVFHRNTAQEDETATQGMLYDAAGALNKNPFTREGYSFSGWNTQPDGSGTSYSDGAIVSKLVTQGEMILYAQWKINSYTVTLNIGGGYVSGANGWKHPDDQSVKPVRVTYTTDYGNNLPTLLPTFSNAGYRFDGWQMDGTDAQLPKTMPGEDQEYVAVYTSYLDLLVQTDVVEDLLAARQYYALLNESQRSSYLTDAAYTSHKDLFFSEIERQGLQKLRAYVVNAQEPTNEILANAKDPEDETLTYKIAEMTVTDEQNDQGIFVSDPPELEGMLTKEDYKARGMLEIEFLTMLFGYGHDTDDYEEITHVKCGDKDWIELTGATGLDGDQFNIMFDIAWIALGEGKDSGQFRDWLLGEVDALTIGELDGASMIVQAKVTTDEQIGVDEAGNAVYFSYIQPYHLYFFNETHQVIFDTQGGESIDPVDVDYLDVTALPDAVRPGYTFLGWFDGTADDSTKVESVTMGKTDITLYAKWNLNTYTVSLDPNGGELAAADQNHWTNNQFDYTVLTTNEIQLPTPERTGYTFGGWFEVLEGGELAENASVSVVPNQTFADKTYRAKWTVNTYRITFNTDGGSAMESITAKYGDAVSVTQQPTKQGYTFSGWSEPIPETMPARDLILDAKWTADTFTVTLDANGGSVEPKQITVTYDETFSALLNLTLSRENYGFVGWYTALKDGKLVQASDTVKLSGDITLYARWEAGAYSISYDLDGGNATGSNPNLYTVESDDIVLSNPTKTGYTFQGWSGNGIDGLSKHVTIPTGSSGDRSYRANWQVNQYTITFAEADGSTIDCITADFASEIPIPANPEKEGYTFAGWDKPIPETMPAEDVTIHAKWTINRWTVTYLDHEGKTLHYAVLDYGTEITPIAGSEREGHSFTGWSPAIPETMPDHDVTVQAQYARNSYTILVYETVGDPNPATLNFLYGNLVDLPEPTREGYIFNGWNVIGNNSGVLEAVPETMPAEDLTVYALWTTEQFDLIFTVDGEVHYSTKVAFGEKPGTIAEPTKTGYTFSGWSQLPETMPAESVTITGTFAANVYTVEFDSNGNVQGTTESQEMTYDTETSLRANGFTRTGYTFTGWNTAADGSGTAYTDGQSVLNLSEINGAKVKLYAIWNANTYNVTLIYDDGVTEDKMITVTYDGTYANLPEPEREGYEFVGWFDGETAYTSTSPVKLTQDQILTAQWNAKGDTPYTVKRYLQNLDESGYTLAGTESFTGATGATVQAAAQQFTGFSLNTQSSTQSGTIEPDGSLVLELYYDRNAYTVTWHVCDQYISETYLYEQVPAYAGQKDYADLNASYTFTGWDAEFEAVRENVTYTALYTRHYQASFFDANGENTITYAYLKDALAAAKNGQTVRLEEDVTLSENLTVPAGVNLLLPYAEKDTGYIVRNNGKLPFNPDGDSTKGNVGVGPNAKLLRTLTIPAGITLNVKGNVLINAMTGRPSAGNYDHDVTGGYSQIKLEGDIVVEKGGNLDCFGYVKGSGQVTAKNGGSIGDLYIVRHWRGGSWALEMYEQGKIYPMNEYDCHNIESDVRVEYGGSYDGMVKMYAKGQYHYTRFPQVNVNNGLIRLREGGYVIRSYAGGVETYKLYGGADFAKSTLNIVGMNLSTAEFLYPFDGGHAFELFEGEYHFLNDYKFLTGCDFTVHSGADLTVDAGVLVVFYDVFRDTATDGTKYPQQDKAVLTIENGASFTNCGTFGGSIFTESADILVSDDPVWGGWSDGITTDSVITKEADMAAKGIMSVNHDLFITRPNYSWRYGDEKLNEHPKAIIWIGADYTELMQALETVPKDLKIYSDETAKAVTDAVDQVIFDLGVDRQDDVDTWTKDIITAVENLKLRIVTVTFDAGQGSVKPASKEITYGDVYGTLPVPDHYGYVFEGWFTQYNDPVNVETEMKETADHSLIAHYTMIPADYTAVDQAIASIPASMNGYTAESVQAVNDAKNAVVRGLGKAEQDRVDAMSKAIEHAVKNLTLITITVSFDANGGTTSGKTFQATYSKPFGTLPEAIRDGFEFIGWYTAKDGGQKVTADTLVASVTDVTLYAKWSNAASTEPGDYTAVDQAIASIPENLEGYTAESVEQLNLTVDAVERGLTIDRQRDIDAWAKAIMDAIASLEFKTITVYFDANGGTCDEVKRQIIYGGNCGVLPKPEKAYSVFLGWFDAAEGGNKITEVEVSSLTRDITLYARYELLKADYTELNRAVAAIPEDLRCYSDESVAALNQVLDEIDYTFTADRQSRVDQWTEMVTAAVAALEYRFVTLTYDPQGGKVDPRVASVQYHSAIGKLPEPKLDYHIFDGWYTAAEGGQKVTPETVVTSVTDFSIYAHWVQIDADYSIIEKVIAEIPSDWENGSYKPEGVEALREALDAVQYGLSAAYQDQINAWALAIRKATRNLERISVTVTYRNGKRNVSATKIVYGQPYGNMPTVTKDGYIFNGWFTAETGGEQITSDMLVQKLEDHTLYAQWTSAAGEDASKPTEPSAPETVQVELTLDPGEGTLNDSKLTVIYGKPYGMLPEPVRRYHIFLGWFTQSEGGKQVTEETFVMQTGDHTLYAHWQYRPMPFEDVAEGWYFDPVYDLYYAGLVSGVSTDPPLFAPDMSTTRGQMITMIYRLMGSPEVSGTSQFVDVQPGVYYEKAVIWGAQNGVVKGISKTEFAPDVKITREQFTAMLYRLYCENFGAVTPSADLSQFPDRDKISDYARDAITWAVEVGIVKGKGDKLEARGLASRAEVATMLQRYMRLTGLLD